MNRRMLVAALAAAFTLLAPAAAQAGSHITWTPQRLTVTTDGAGDFVSLYTREYVINGQTVVFPAFSTGGPTTWAPNENCIEDAGYIVCDQAASFLFQGGGGADTLSISDEPELNAVPATLNGGGGNDKLQDFSPAARTLDGGEGNDVIFGSGGNDTIRGGNGNDEVDGEGGNDNVSGGGGNDKLYGDHLKPQGSDVIDGGPGFDRVIDDYPVGEGPVTVTLDNVANDGRAGENDNLISIEEIEGPPGTYVGSNAAETFTVGATGQTSSVSGGGGNDTITTLNGSDSVDGGPGDDRLVTGFDNDNVTGGPGRDTIFSDATSSFCGIFSCTVPFGNDTVNARDGEADTIDCGVGADRAVVDAIDTRANCETVDQGLIDSGTFGARTLVTLALRVKRIPARGPVAIRVSNRNGFPITGRLGGRTAKRVSVSAKRRLIKLKSKSFRVGPNARKTVKLKLPKSLQRLLRRKRKLTLRLSARVKDPSGKSRTVTKKLTVRLKKPRGKR